MRGPACFPLPACHDHDCNGWARACSCFGKTGFTLGKKLSSISGWWNEKCLGPSLKSARFAWSSSMAKPALCTHVDVQRMLLKKAIQKPWWLLQQVTESHQHSWSILDVVNMPLSMNKVQLRAIMQTPQLLGTKRKKFGGQPGLYTQPIPAALSSFSPGWRSPPESPTMWGSLREAAAPELPKSLRQSWSWARLWCILSGNRYLLVTAGVAKCHCRWQSVQDGLVLWFGICLHPSGEICDVTCFRIS